MSRLLGAYKLDNSLILPLVAARGNGQNSHPEASENQITYINFSIFDTFLCRSFFFSRVFGFLNGDDVMILSCSEPGQRFHIWEPRHRPVS